MHTLLTKEQALPGREEAIKVNPLHAVNNNPVQPKIGKNLSLALFGMGCFWGAERTFWVLDGVFSTSVGYAAGLTKNATYEEVCSGMTGHNEVVRVIYDHTKTDYKTLLKTFWTNHNPTQGYQQGNDRGTQYRSGIYYYNNAQREAAEDSLKHYQHQLKQQGQGKITTEILPAPEFYFAEDYHQQYLHKNPHGYCGLGGLDIPF